MNISSLSRRLARLALPALFSLLVVSTLRAQVSGVDLNFAFSQLKTSGPAPFATALYNTDTEAARRMVVQLALLANNAGPYVGYEVISRKSLTQKVERLIIAVYYENRPLYLRLDFYASDRGPICLPFLLSREASDVLPYEIIAKTGR